MTCTKKNGNWYNSHLVKKLSSPSPVILFNTCLERVAEACNAEITDLLRLQLTPDSVHKLLLATASLLLEFWSAVNIESEKELTVWIDWSTVKLSKARLLRALSCTNLPAKKSRTNYQCCKWYCTLKGISPNKQWIHQDLFWDTKIPVLGHQNCCLWGGYRMIPRSPTYLNFWRPWNQLWGYVGFEQRRDHIGGFGLKTGVGTGFAWDEDNEDAEDHHDHHHHQQEQEQEENKNKKIHKEEQI